MKKVIVIPDSFKGSLSSEEVTRIIAEEIDKAANGETEIIKLPIADGGEGSTNCIINSLGGRKINVLVKSPENKDIEAYYGIIEKDESKMAVIEIAESSGITKQTSYDAKAATTYGFGQLIKDALDKGCRDFLLCLGGSATTDCGLGMAAALSVNFFDENGKYFIPVGGSLSDVKSIDVSQIDDRICKSTFTVMCDVDNPLYGEKGAAYVYGPQKGASPDDVKLMDEGLRNISVIYENTKCKDANVAGDLSLRPGAGAAGGAGFACMAFLNATMKSGIEAMLEIVDFDRKVKEADLVVTGEGKIDEQSFMGKVLSGIISHSAGKKIVAFCGTSCIKGSNNGIDIVEIGRGVELEESIKNAEIYLQKSAKEYFKDIL
ncbi:MAG: glycerate kinase [Lachnospiraceae bacterium]|nr:glycerate kinase [Lachnospiraceae bacterium]